jgi:Protein phosphatase 2C
VTIRRAWLPKAGSSAAEYEDAAWPEVDRATEAGPTACAAVADGASESMLAGPWARLLARAACCHGPAALPAALRDAGRSWPAEVAAYLADRPVAWWQQEKLRRGAQATVLVVQVGPAGEWRAASVGDSCLFHCRDGQVLRAFPVTAPDDFGVRPELAVSTAVETSRIRRAAGRCRPGDRLVLATDAVAEWVLRAAQAGGNPVPVLESLVAVPGNARLATWAQAQRAPATGALRNDDITLVVLELTQPAGSAAAPG